MKKKERKNETTQLLFIKAVGSEKLQNQPSETAVKMLDRLTTNKTVPLIDTKQEVLTAKKNMFQII